MNIVPAFASLIARVLALGIRMPEMRHMRSLILVLSSTCPAVPSTHAAETVAQKYPDVVSASVHARGADSFDFDVTVSSPYDTPQRYADAFRVSSRDGTVFGERILWHDHAGEQPFTRDLYGVRIPEGIRSVSIQARDKKYGYGGKAIEVTLPGR